MRVTMDFLQPKRTAIAAVTRQGSYPVKAPADLALRPTRAEIDLSALTENYVSIRNWVSPAKVLAVVKADGYGHGAIEVAKTLEAAGAYGFGVALAEEGLELREAGVAGEVFVLNGVFGGAHAEVLRARLTPVVFSIAEVGAFAKVAGAAPVEVHLKVDTGMSRLGVPFEEVGQFVERLRSFPGVHVVGVLTHLAASDSDPEFTAVQFARLRDAVGTVRRGGHPVRCVHAANSGGCAPVDGRFDLVRPGLSIYGVTPASWSRLHSRGEQAQAPRLKPALRLRSEIVALRTLRLGDTVGYDRTYKVSREGTRVAIAPVGYGDGIFWTSGGRGDVCREVLVAGRRCPVAGRVSMDLTAIDVTSCPEAAIGDEVTLLGTQGSEEISVTHAAEAAGTIPYEVLTNISRRVPRVYHW